MSILGEVIKQTRQMIEDFDADKLPIDRAVVKLSMLTLIHKSSALILENMALAVRLTKDPAVNLLDMMRESNLIGQGEAIEVAIVDAELENIKCKATGETIMRSACLEYSGDHDEGPCSECNQNVITKKRLGVWEQKGGR